MNAQGEKRRGFQSQPSRSRPPRGVSVYVYVLLALLLVLPVYALSRLAAWIDWRLLVAAPLAISIFTFFMYRSDKKSAEAGEWRIPEAMLHFAELVGGWPGAFLAQRSGELLAQKGVGSLCWRTPRRTRF